jgi:hypothetical protein
VEAVLVDQYLSALFGESDSSPQRKLLLSGKVSAEVISMCLHAADLRPKLTCKQDDSSAMALTHIY